MKKGKVFFNSIIIITVIAFISMVGYVLYYYISNYLAVKEAEEAVEEFEQEVMVVEIEDPVVQQNTIEQPTTQEPQKNTNTTTKKTNSNTKYKGYSMIGTIQIPKTKVKAPIVDRVTPNSIAAAVGTLYGPGLNQVGNTVLAAHNYRNRNLLFK